MSKTTYHVATPQGWIGEHRKVSNIDDAFIFSRAGAIHAAEIHGGQPFSYNYDSRKLRRVVKGWAKGGAL